MKTEFGAVQNLNINCISVGTDTRKTAITMTLQEIQITRG